MLFVTTYKIKPYISNEETKELLQVFAEAGPGPGTTAHYVAADGSHGVVVAETDDEHPQPVSDPRRHATPGRDQQHQARRGRHQKEDRKQPGEWTVTRSDRTQGHRCESS